MIWNTFSRAAFLQAATSVIGPYPREAGLKFAFASSSDDDNDQGCVVYLPLWTMDWANFCQLSTKWSHRLARFAKFETGIGYDIGLENCANMLDHAFLHVNRESPKTLQQGLIERVCGLNLDSEPSLISQLVTSNNLIEEKLHALIADPSLLKTVNVYYRLADQ